jgi:hypothetical protein
VAATATAGLVGLSFDLLVSSATNRYLGDSVGALVVLATLGVYLAVEALERWRWVRRIVVGLALLLAVASLWAGFALGLPGQYGHLQYHNPPLYQKLVEHFSACHGEIAPEPK